VRVHGVGLEDGDRPPHKQNKRGEGRRGGYNEEGADGENENVGEQLNRCSGGTLLAGVSHPPN